MSDKRIRVLVVPAGSRIALGIIKFLAPQKNIRLVSADSDRLSAGLYISHKPYLVSRFCKEKEFFKDLSKIIRKENIDIVIPALDPLLVKFSEYKKFFEDLGVKVLLSPSASIDLTRDKWRTYNHLKEVIPLPRSFVDKDKMDMPYPVFVKPRCGSGSIDAWKAGSKEDLNFYCKRITSPIIQEYLEGREYTVDCLADMNGKLMFCIPRIRLATRAGVSIKGKVLRSRKIENIAGVITEKIKFNGPFFFQLKEKGRVLKLTEINARFSGGMPLSAVAGPNIYTLSLELFLGYKIKRIPRIKYGLYFSRFDKEIYITEKKIKSIKTV